MSFRNLDKLTAAERDVLLLLAQGHDTKSASARLDISIHAVNDRLREARRKLGVTSSREAARLLIGMGNAEPQISSGDFSGDAAMKTAGQFRPRRSDAVLIVFGVIAMLALALAVFLFAVRPVQAVPPRVIAASPAQGSVIAPGSFTLTVTFDRPMRDKSWSFVQVSPESYPDCKGSPVRSRDGRSFALRCTAQAGKRYEIWFNRGQFRNFRANDGTPAEPFMLRFAVEP